MSARSLLKGAMRVLTLDTINPQLIKAQYAVRGELAIRAEELRMELQKNPEMFPFKRVIFCNIGNPQHLKQRPLTYFRQMLSLIEWPELVEGTSEDGTRPYPPDVVQKASNLVACIGSTGSYTHSQGLPVIREAVARFIERRDGFPSDAKNVFLTNGASDAVTRILECIITAPNIGVMIPIPQYPLYSAVITLLNGTAVPYYLDESTNWSLPVAELERAIAEARTQGTEVRALCIINPGNPTGSCFTQDTLKEIVAFCKREGLILLADEVYQENVYGSCPFVSARRVAGEMGESGDIEVISFHSISKGLIGECGHRGGYYECFNVGPEILDLLYKQCSICLCANVPGQIMVGLMVDPPVSGDASFPQYSQERQEIWASLKRRAVKMQRALAAMSGVECNEAAGAMYLFPRLHLPERLIEHAQLLGRQPDDLYAMDLLNATGICVVPGNGFGQVPGTFHIRTTFLPAEEDFDAFIALWQDFHERFMAAWR